MEKSLKDKKRFERFEELNPKRTTILCCKGECLNNYIREDNTLQCGNCEERKHLDFFLESGKGYLCEECFFSEEYISSKEWCGEHVR